ncbi:sulfotransferase family protein [Flavobacteriaceae bacterium MAR_2010_105]|nr:sulfotransferase family protein [Flavobacteriaceae bacterium MAR_2010_105]
MKSKNIFIHIPKTGGTTINCAMNNSQWQTKPDFNYRHIIYETKKSNSKDIFLPENHSKYLEFKIFMLLRNPIDRLISEYYFIKDRPEFMSLIRPVPRSLKEYIKNKQTNNYMIGFLVGKRMYDKRYVNNEDYELVINAIEKLNIHVGLFEEFEKSLLYFGTQTKIKWPKNIPIKRITLSRPKFDDVSDEIKELIIKHNSLDFKLYNYCKTRFDNQALALNKTSNFNFVGNKYDYVLKYTERFVLLEIALKNKLFIQKHHAFFNSLNLHLHNELRFRKGEEYVFIWNKYLVASIDDAFNDTPLSNLLNQIELTNTDPLKDTEEICKVFNEININTNAIKYTYNSKLIFDPKIVDIKSEFKKQKNKKSNNSFSIFKLFQKK